MDDILIRGGQVIDGTGAPARVADVAIRAGRIVAIEADRTESADRPQPRRRRARRPVSLCQYPYNWATNPLRLLLPSWLHEGGIGASEPGLLRRCRGRRCFFEELLNRAQKQDAVAFHHEE